MKLSHSGFLFLLLFLPITANASGPYFQVDIVNAVLDGTHHAYPGDKYLATPTGLGFKGGMKFNPNFSVEGTLALGLSDDYFDDYSNIEVGIDSIAGAYGVFYIPISPYVDLFAKLGYASVDYKDSDGDKITGSGLSYGFGSGFYLGPGMMMFEYVVYPDTKYDDDLILDEYGNPGGRFTVDSSSLNIGYRMHF